MPLIELPVGVFATDASTIVVPTNCVGPMGKGLAAEARDRVPNLYGEYLEACADRRIRPGVLFLYGYRHDPRKVVCLPTKRHWRDMSFLSDVALGVAALARTAPRLGTIALPKLGCGLGGLDWEHQVRPMLYHFLGDLDNRIYVCKGTTGPAGRWPDMPFAVEVIA